MTLGKLVMATILVVAVSPANAVVLTFDDVPPRHGSLGYYYQQAYGIAFSGDLYVTDHSASSWGPPHSGNNVLVSNADWFLSQVGFKWGVYPVLYEPLACSVGAYFSTEPGVVLEMTAYYSAPSEELVAVGSATIGALGESWQNVLVQILGSPKPIRYLNITPVTQDALLHFCVDDLNVEFVPEPTSLLALCVGLLPLLLRRRR